MLGVRQGEARKSVGAPRFGWWERFAIGVGQSRREGLGRVDLDTDGNIGLDAAVLGLGVDRGSAGALELGIIE